MTFPLVGGNVALDLVNTVQHRDTDPVDLLNGPGDLARWLVDAGVTDSPGKVGGDEFGTTVRLRAAIHHLATGTFNAADRRLLNRAGKPAPVRLRLAKDGSLTRTGDTEAAIATIARAAIELLTGESAGLIKECAADDCTLLYVDNSRRGSRRWCDMRECGNRAKVAAFRARHA